MGKGGGGGSGAGKIEIPQALGSGQGSLYSGAFQPLGTFGSSTLGSLGSLYNWASDIATGGNVGGLSYGYPGTGMITANHPETYAPFTTGGIGGGSGLNPFNGGTGVGGGGTDPLLGPLLSGEMSSMGEANQAANNFASLLYPSNGGQSPFGLGSSLIGSGTGLIDKGTGMLDTAMNKGLFPSQQAEIDQAVASQQAAVQQQLGSEGLGSSTVAKQLTGQVKMSGAAAAGQLIQGNMQLGEAEQQIGESEQQIGVGEQQLGVQAQSALFSQFMGLANQNQSIQSQMYTQALQGIGELGSMMNATLQPFGYSMQTQQSVLAANVSEAQLQTQANTGAAEASQQGFGSLMGGLGALFGQGGSSGGLLGGLGSLIGGGGGAGGLAGFGANIAQGVGGAAAGAGGAAGGLGGLLGSIGSGAGSAIGAIGSAISAIFASSCTAGRNVPGVTDIRWVLFRDWILYRAPSLVRMFYVEHSDRVNGWLKYEWFREPFLFLVGQIVEHDQNTRTV